MKIILINKFYYTRGGDCIYTLNLEQLLKQKGHDVAVFSMQYPKNLNSKYNRYFPCEVKFSFAQKLKNIESFLRIFGTSEVKRKFIALLDDFMPDVVHLNNIHTYLSPIVAKLAHNKGIKVIWTLHDYKLLCPRYDCLRNGKICELCFFNKSNVIKYNCLKNSRIASLLGYFEAIFFNRTKLEIYTDLFICPSEFLKQKMIQGGYSNAKLRALCNFIDVKKTEKGNYKKENYYCYIGRLSLEKGLETLLKAASELPYQLKIIGGGPLEPTL